MKPGRELEDRGGKMNKRRRKKEMKKQKRQREEREALVNDLFERQTLAEIRQRMTAPRIIIHEFYQ
jgi:hypothetical protein